MKKKRKDWLLCLFIVSFTMFGLYASCYIYVFSNYRAHVVPQYNESTRYVMEIPDSGAIIFEKSPGAAKNLRETENSCSPIDIAIVVGGNTAIRRVTSLLKSILLYRSRPLRFHFVVADSLSRRIVATLMTTWQVTGVEFTTYNAEAFLDDLRWIPNNHYSGVYGLLKVLLPDILPYSLHKVIVLDNDLLFNGDVLDLWSLFSKFNDNQVLGLVENLSPWYLGSLPIKYSPWPAINRGYNTGVILMDLQRLRKSQWSKTWTIVCNTTLSSHGPLGLADQDVFNAWIKINPSVVYTVPCKWNFQIGKSVSYEYCELRPNEAKVIHFNSVFKSGDIRDKIADYFRKRYRDFFEMNNLLGNAWDHSECAVNYSTDFVNSGTMEKDDPCADFAAPITYRTHLYYKDYSYNPKPVDVTLVTQLSFDRIFMLEPLLNRWNGPLSITVYLTDEEAARFQDFMVESQILSSRLNVALHIVYRKENFYPINKLRNIALKEVNTSHVFLSDIDFIPSAGSYEYLLGFLNDTNSLTKEVFVVPAFENREYKTKAPENKSALAYNIELGLVEIFRQDEWERGHAATNYAAWLKTNETYEVLYQTDYEPYIVARRAILPLYDERFVGFGWNKVQHIMELSYASFKFIVLPNIFLVHQPHSPSFDVTKFRSNAVYRRCLKLLKGQFIKDLIQKYP